MRDAVVLPLRLLPMLWSLTVRVSLDFLGYRGVCVCWLLVTVPVLVTASTIGGMAREFDGARTVGGMAAVGVPQPPLSLALV